jgi:hypothetical protein
MWNITPFYIITLCTFTSPLFLYTEQDGLVKCSVTHVGKVGASRVSVGNFERRRLLVRPRHIRWILKFGRIVMEWDVTLSNLGASGQGEEPLVSCCKHDTNFACCV